MHHINTSCGSEGYYRIRNRGLDTTETYSEHSVHQSACVAQRGTGDITIKRHHMENDFTRKILHHYAFCGSDVYYLGFTSIARARARACGSPKLFSPEYHQNELWLRRLSGQISDGAAAKNQCFSTSQQKKGLCLLPP